MIKFSTNENNAFNIVGMLPCLIFVVILNIKIRNCLMLIPIHMMRTENKTPTRKWNNARQSNGCSLHDIVIVYGSLSSQSSYSSVSATLLFEWMATVRVHRMIRNS